MGDFIQNLGSLRSPISTYANLPITGNVLGDLRILTDVGDLYTWTSESSSGDLTNWKKVTVSSYNDLTGRPDSSVLAINDATQSYVRLCLNHVWLLYIYAVNALATIYKMVAGFMDRFNTSDEVGIDLTKCENQVYLTRTLRNIGYEGATDDATWYAPNKNDLDNNTKMLIHGREVLNSIGGAFEFRDLMRTHYIAHDVIGNNTITKFGNGSMDFTSLGSYVEVANEVLIGGVQSPYNMDFSCDFWIYPLSDATEETIFTHSTLVIKKTDANKILMTMEIGETEEYLNQIIVSLESLSSITIDSWNHVVVQRRNGIFEIYINGTLDIQSASYPGAFYYHQTITIGSFFGYLEEFRYARGMGVNHFTGSFTPLTREYNYSATEKVMKLQSNGFEAAAIPTSARIVLFEEDIDVIDPNTDLKAYISRDGGTTFSQVTLERISDMPDVAGKLYWYEAPLPTDVLSNIFTGAVNISTQPSGKEMVYKITSHNNKDLRVRSVTVEWK
jgi:hypothetical protein